MALDKGTTGAASAALTLLGVSAFAVAQPLLDVLAKHTAFLIAHSIDRFDLLLLTMVLSVGPGLVAFGLFALVGTVSRATSRIVLLAFVAAGIAATVLPPLHRSVNLPGVVLLAAAALLGAAAAIAIARLPAARSFAQILAIGVVGFPLWFLAATPASQLLAPDEPDTPLVSVTSRTPVVLVIFDQLPLFSLLDGDEQIDGLRYPHFRALAETSEWYRNATAVAAETVYAVPAILTGRYPEPQRLPTYRDHPQNLFSLLGRDYALNAVQTLTDLCPPSLCPEAAIDEPRGERLRAVFRDLFYVYLHVLLPDDLQGGLPDVGSTWRDFQASEWIARDATADDPHSSWGDPTSAFDRFLAGIDGRRERVLHFLHVNSPLVPWKYLPSGTVYGPVGRHLYPYPMNGLADVSPGDGWALDRALQRHLLQVGYADRLLGELVERLGRAGVWDDALVIVTADHGISFWPGRSLLDDDQRMASDVLNVPLFVKRPGADRGKVSDANVETIDILPTIAVSLGLSLPQAIDGRPLGELDRGRDGKQAFLEIGDALARVDYGSRLAGRRLSVNRVKRVFGEGPSGLFEIGDHPDWIGRLVSALPHAEGATPRQAVELERAADFANVDPEGPYLPARITGEVRALSGVPAAAVAIALNGVVWATTRTFESSSGVAGFSAMVPQAAFRLGANDVEVFVLEGRGQDAVLRRVRQAARRHFALEEDASGRAVLRGPDGDLAVVPGALSGQVNTRGPILAGWTRDTTHGVVPESVVVFANGRFYEERDLARARANIAVRAHLRDADQKTLVFDVVIPFEILRESQHPELRVFAISQGVASELEYLEGFPYRGAPSD